MSIEYPNEKFLFDEDGSFVAFNPIKDPYTALAASGYQVIDLTYNRNVYISKESLEDFDPIEETGQIGYSKKNKFKVFYKYWYNIDLKEQSLNHLKEERETIIKIYDEKLETRNKNIARQEARIKAIS